MFIQSVAQIFISYIYKRLVIISIEIRITDVQPNIEALFYLVLKEIDVVRGS